MQNVINKNKRILLTVGAILASPFIAYLSVLVIKFIFNFGVYTGIFIRSIYNLVGC